MISLKSGYKFIKCELIAEKSFTLYFYLEKLLILNHLETLMTILHMPLLEKSSSITLFRCHFHEDRP